MTDRTKSPDAPFWNRIAGKYAARPIGDIAAYEDKLAALRELLGPEDRVLEIGCGSGNTAVQLAGNVAHVTGADFSPAMIEIARARLGEGAPNNVRFVEAEASRPVPGAPFDAVLAFSLLHLVRDLPGTLAQVRAQIRPGGLFLSKTVCLGDGSVLFRPLLGAMRLVGRAPFVAILKRTELEAQIAAAGFSVQGVRYFGRSTTSPFIVARAPA